MRRGGTDRLASVGTGTTVRITDVDAAGPQRLRMAELGLRRGAEVTVLGRMAGGGQLVGLGVGRLAVDRATAAAVAVGPAS